MYMMAICSALTIEKAESRNRAALRIRRHQKNRKKMPKASLEKRARKRGAKEKNNPIPCEDYGKFKTLNGFLFSN